MDISELKLLKQSALKLCLNTYRFCLIGLKDSYIVYRGNSEL
jgi:hypothetical protein